MDHVEIIQHIIDSNIATQIAQKSNFSFKNMKSTKFFLVAGSIGKRNFYIYSLSSPKTIVILYYMYTCYQVQWNCL